jgi:hypothetical protein
MNGKKYSVMIVLSTSNSNKILLHYFFLIPSVCVQTIDATYILGLNEAELLKD